MALELDSFVAVVNVEGFGDGVADLLECSDEIIRVIASSCEGDEVNAADHAFLAFDQLAIFAFTPPIWFGEGGLYWTQSTSVGGDAPAACLREMSFEFIGSDSAAHAVGICENGF
jgi:hypothetical protein